MVSRPGDLLTVRPVDGPPGSAGFSLRYRSTTATGRAAVVSGVAYLPSSRPAGTPLPVVAWAHGTFGLGRQCTTQAYFTTTDRLGLVTLAVQYGVALVATDYQGLGSPGAHPYMVGRCAARNVLDSVRGALRLPGADPDPEVFLLGWSQGGHAALLAAEEQPEYAPELRLTGTAAVAPAADLHNMLAFLDGSPRFGYVLMTVYGMRAAYPELRDNDHLLTPAGRAALRWIATRSVEEILAEFAGRRAAAFGVADLLSTDAFRQRLTENEPGYAPVDVPVLLVHGDADDTVPVASARELARRYGEQGSPVSLRVLSGFGHPDVLAAALPEVVCHISDCLAAMARPVVPPVCEVDPRRQ
jgi:pimeloyl-ACP methyl ester carboxylesterase